jgi:ribosome-binding protein aMBF1 (putative translation factor)
VSDACGETIPRIALDTVDGACDIRHTLDMGTSLDSYIQEVRERYTETERAHLDAEMRRFDLAGQLLSLRLDAGVTQQELAGRSGISQADISRYERGLGNPTHATIDALAVALGAHLELVRNAKPSAQVAPAGV